MTTGVSVLYDLVLMHSWSVWNSIMPCADISEDIDLAQ